MRNDFAPAASAFAFSCASRESRLLPPCAEEATLDAFLRERRQQGELAAETDTEALSRYLSCMLQGMSVRAREGASCEEHNGIIDTMMALWPKLAGVCQDKK